MNGTAGLDGYKYQIKAMLFLLLERLYHTDLFLSAEFEITKKVAGAEKSCDMVINGINGEKLIYEIKSEKHFGPNKIAQINNLFSFLQKEFNYTQAELIYRFDRKIDGISYRIFHDETNSSDLFDFLHSQLSSDCAKIIFEYLQKIQINLTYQDSLKVTLYLEDRICNKIRELANKLRRGEQTESTKISFRDFISWLYSGAKDKIPKKSDIYNENKFISKLTDQEIKFEQSERFSES